MARYKIASLNYITSGSKRTLVNMDVQMLYQNIKHIYILSHEKDQLSNIVTEQFDFKYLPTEYIEKEHPINNRQSEYSHTQRPLSDNYDLFPHSLSSEPLSEEEVPSSIILNEKQKYGYETSLSDHMRILLQTRENTAKIQNQMDSFKRYQKNKTFVIEDRTSEKGFCDVNTV